MGAQVAKTRRKHAMK